MHWVLVLAVIIAVAVIVLAKLAQKGKTGTSNYPYQKTGNLFSPAERSFLGVLNQAVEEDAIVLGKVRVADVVIPTKGLSRSEWQKAFNRISAKHFDFLLCNNKDTSVFCAVELNDSSHLSKNRQERDEFLKKACAAAGIPIIQIPTKPSYVIDEIRNLLAPYIGEKRIATQTLQAVPVEAQTNNRRCPKCSSPLVRRIAKKGSNAGNEFWACNAFPKCRYVENYKGS